MLWEQLAGARVVDLAHGMRRGMPVSPNHPRFEMSLLRRHGDMVRADGGSAANELIVTGGHVGTHIDALCHVSQDGRLHGGIPADSVTTNHGFSHLGVETIEPIVCRGVMLDVAAAHGVYTLPGGYEVTAADLEAAQAAAGVEVSPGDAVLVRTGWSHHWDDPETFVGQRGGAPGPGVEAADWLIDAGVRVTGAETIAYEAVAPGEGHATLPVHRRLLVDAGVNIIEVLDLRRLDACEFLFVAAPLKIVGATGSPIRPLAVIAA